MAHLGKATASKRGNEAPRTQRPRPEARPPGQRPFLAPPGGSSQRRLVELAAALPGGGLMLTAEETLEEDTWRWREAQALARTAYQAWHERGGATAYAAYRDAQDRADEAQDALAWRVQSRVRST